MISQLKKKNCCEFAHLLDLVETDIAVDRVHVFLGHKVVVEGLFGVSIGAAGVGDVAGQG
jgi:hypothetical protein